MLSVILVLSCLAVVIFGVVLVVVKCLEDIPTNTNNKEA